MVRGFVAWTLLAADAGVAQGSYVKGDGNSNDCPEGTQKVVEEGACKVAAWSVGGIYQEAGNWADHPGGCYTDKASGEVWFNTNPGAAHLSYQEVCQTTPPALPARLVKGPYAVKSTRYPDVDALDSSGASHGINVWYPVGAKGQKFPLIAYAHGFTDGGKSVANHYDNHLTELAAFGYIIAAHESCDTGCSDWATNPGDPTGFKNYYKQQWKVLDWAKERARSGDPLFSAMNLAIGVGIAGHSMGGQSTLYAAGEEAASYGIKAAVMHHAYTHSYPAPTVPFLAFTGTKDTTATPDMTSQFYNADGAHPVKGLVNKMDMGHLEPRESDDFNVALASLTAAWFKLHLDETPTADGIDYHDLIFSKMCDGEYDGAMEQCEVQDGSDWQVV